MCLGRRRQACDGAGNGDRIVADNIGVTCNPWKAHNGIWNTGVEGIVGGVDGVRQDPLEIDRDGASFVG